MKLTDFFISKLTEWETRRGIGFTMTIKYKNTIVAVAHNDGVGGCNKYDVRNKALFSTLNQLADSKIQMPEALDCILGGCDKGSNLGVGAEEFLTLWNQ